MQRLYGLTVTGSIDSNTLEWVLIVTHNRLVSIFLNLFLICEGPQDHSMAWDWKTIKKQGYYLEKNASFTGGWIFYIAEDFILLLPGRWTGRGVASQTSSARSWKPTWGGRDTPCRVWSGKSQRWPSGTYWHCLLLKWIWFMMQVIIHSCLIWGCN